LEHMKRNVAVLSVCQALANTNNTILIALGALVGYSLADNKLLATLPVASVMIGTMLFTIPASFWMRRVGRKYGFITGILIGMTGASICSWAIYTHNFWLFCVGTGLVGVNNSFVQQYRFAAADAASVEFRPTAISLVMFGGVAAAFLGPQSAKLTQGLFASYTYLGSYVSTIGIAFVAGTLLLLVRIPNLTAEQRSTSGRPLKEIAKQPAFIVAVVGAMVGYGVMSLIMTSTPLSIVADAEASARELGIAFDKKAALGNSFDVITAHVVGMFGPSFFTGTVIKRFGVLNVMMAGAVLLAACVGVSLVGHELHHYFGGLIVLGIGWNFLFIGGTTLLTECYSESEKAKVQGFNDFLVFGTVAIASLSSGSIFHFMGWESLNQVAIPFLIISFLASLWLALKRRKEARIAT
jgi:MFS family permease